MGDEVGILSLLMRLFSDGLIKNRADQKRIIVFWKEMNEKVNKKSE